MCTPVAPSVLLVAVTLWMAVGNSDRTIAADTAPVPCSLGDSAIPLTSSVLTSFAVTSVSASMVIDWSAPMCDTTVQAVRAYDCYNSACATAEGLAGSAWTTGSEGRIGGSTATSESGRNWSAADRHDAAELPILAAPERDALPMACIGLVGAAWACRRQLKRADHGVERGAAAAA
jgi:hypothetical protein